ncbi:MAG: hypothetical protein ACW99G_07230 [Candidatus Thorarchaeota archaeon]|jgi:hypothetical protein
MRKTRLYSKLYKLETGQKSGTYIERALSQMGGFTKPNTTKYDKDFDDKKIELKTMRAVSEMVSAEGESLVDNLNRLVEDTMYSRALYSVKGEIDYGITPDGQKVYIGEQSFCQQVKPAQFDYLIACCVFLDVIRVYVVPSSHISNRVGRRAKGKLTMTEQHRNPHEGVLRLKQILDYHVFDFSEKISDFDNLEINFTPYFKQRKTA